MSAKKRTWTAAEIAKLPEAEYDKHRDEIMAALKEGRIERPPYRTSVRLGDR